MDEELEDLAKIICGRPWYETLEDNGDLKNKYRETASRILKEGYRKQSPESKCKYSHELDYCNKCEGRSTIYQWVLLTGKNMDIIEIIT